MVQAWNTATFLSSGASSIPNALIILNTSLPPHHLFKRLWAAADLKYCADGGANRLFDSRHVLGDGDSYLPDLIKGDLDSLREDVREYYKSKNVPIIHDPDQDSTDLGKCVAALVDHELRTGVEHQLVISGGLSGRLDQTAHTIHALTLLAEIRQSTWAVGNDSIACVLKKGKHAIQTDLSYFGDTCAVLPFGEEAKVITRGLKWDLGPTSYAYPTSIATIVSSSNHLANEHVDIETNVPVVWTVEVRDRIK